MQHGKFAFSTQLTDCETLEQSMREDCREAVQNLEAGSSDLAVGSSEIEYDVNCETTFIGGYFDVADRAGNVLKVSYDGCGPASGAFNGQPVPPAEC